MYKPEKVCLGVVKIDPISNFYEILKQKKKRKKRCGEKEEKKKE